MYALIDSSFNLSMEIFLRFRLKEMATIKIVAFSSIFPSQGTLILIISHFGGNYSAPGHNKKKQQMCKDNEWKMICMFLINDNEINFTA